MVRGRSRGVGRRLGPLSTAVSCLVLAQAVEASGAVCPEDGSVEAEEYKEAVAERRAKPATQCIEDEQNPKASYVTFAEGTHWCAFSEITVAIAESTRAHSEFCFVEEIGVTPETPEAQFDEAGRRVIGLYRKDREHRRGGVFKVELNAEAQVGSGAESQADVGDERQVGNGAEGQVGAGDEGQIGSGDQGDSDAYLLIDTIGPCSGDLDCSSEIIVGTTDSESIVLSAAVPEIRLAIAEGLTEALDPSIGAVLLNGEKIHAVKVAIVEGDLSLRLSGGSEAFGRLEFLMTGKIGPNRTVRLDLGRAEGYNDSPTALGLRVELALARKLIADEMFLQSERLKAVTAEVCGIEDPGVNELLRLSRQDAPGCDILKKYGDARKALPRCGGGTGTDDCGVLSADQLATIRLVEADVAYREALLERAVPFLGGYRSMRPTTPHQELIKLRALLQRIVETSERMERWQFRAADLDLKEVENEAQRIYTLGQGDSQRKRARIERVRSSGNEASIAKLEARKRHLAQQMVLVSERAQRVADDQDALTAQAGKLIQAGVASATGIPVADVKALAEGDLEGLVSEYVREQVMAEAGGFFDEFVANSEFLSDAYGEFGRRQEELQGAIEDVTQYESELRALRSAFDGSLHEAKAYAEDLYGRVGTGILNALEDGANEGRLVDALEEILASTKPVATLVQAVSQTLGEEAATERGKWVRFYGAVLESAKQVRHEERAAVDRLWAEVSDEAFERLPAAEADRFRALILTVLLEHAVDDDRFYDRFQDDVARIFPGFLASRRIADAIDNARPNDTDAVRRALVQGEVTTLVRFDRAEREIQIRRGREPGWESIGVRALVADLIEEQQASLSRAELARFFRENRGHLGKEVAFVAAASLAGIQNLSVELDQELRRLPNARGLTDAWSALQRDEWAEAMKLTRAEVLAAVAFGPDGGSVAERSPSVGAVGLLSEPPAVSPDAEVLVHAGLNAVFPGAGIAWELGKAWASMDANRGLLDALDRQMVQIVGEYSHVDRAIAQANENSVIAKLENERAVALAEAANAQIQQFNFAMDLAHDEAKLMEQRLRVYRPYFFYNAEMLRERFNAFDRSLSVWSRGRADSGFLAQQIQSDPRNARLALDTEIHLFGWLNREREATKTDPYHLVNHWQQLIALAEDYCADYGCKPGLGGLGKIAATVPARLLGDLGGPDLAEEFANWRESADRSDGFRFALALTTAHRLVPRSYLNVRLLDVNVVAIDGLGRPLEGNLIQLQHTGFSKISYEDREDGSLRWIDEQLLPSAQMPPSSSTPFDLVELSQRFQSQVDQISLASLRGFEGYGFYGSYEVVVADHPMIDRVEDFEIQMAYVYQEANDIRDEGDYLSRLGPGGERCPGPAETVDELEQLSASQPVAYCEATLTISVRGADEEGNCETKEHRRSIRDAALIDAWLDIESASRTLSGGDERGAAAWPPPCVAATRDVRVVRVPREEV